MLWDKEAKIWLYHETVDMRKAVNGLSQIVAEQFQASPHSGDIFIFINHAKNRVKALFWSFNGFCLLYKRLEKDSFKLPRDLSEGLSLNERQLYRLLEGLHFINDAAKKDIIYC